MPSQPDPHIKKGMTAPVVTISKEVDLKACESKENRKTQWSDMNKQTEVAIEVNTDRVPNVIGMGAKDAVFAIEQTGMIARLNGGGTVVQQSVAAGTTPLKGGTVYLELRQ